MSREEARERIKAIEKRQRALYTVGLPINLAIAATLIGRMLLDAEDLPAFLQNDYLHIALALVLFVAVVWLSVLSRKCSRDRDEILAKYGIW